MAKQVMKWTTDDGKTFNTKKEADNHEALVELVGSFDPIYGISESPVQYSDFAEWASDNAEWLADYVRVST